ncbi:hypothetical protein B5M42_015615 [Paenibacillus athensensis]|uniref:Uncharacterized protein n=1 Tax=Paenibacillus athensensis TaxID=1967502 RepID=A0A4Y8Q847_9BACL|nr:hypothetical protein [Paenibacillus athensensis]MCD1260239.1 hypothetical protein [Paenibacillus athensensis]
MSLQFLLQDKPTKLWKDRMIEFDDELFTEERLELSDKLLGSYVNKLEAIQKDEDKRDVKIMSAVKDVVIAFNELNDEHDYFIDTMEREELAEFIDKAAKAAGLEIEDGFDITEEWREW